MSYLKQFMNRKYDLLIMSGEGSWTRNFTLRARVLVWGSGIGIALFSGLIITLGILWQRTGDYDNIEMENRQLRQYRDQVRRAVMNSHEYGLLGAELVQDLLVTAAAPASSRRFAEFSLKRRGGMVFDSFYFNFLDNVPTLPPVNGFVTRGLLLQELDLQVNHSGIDIAAASGDLVQASASGLVVFSQWTDDLGNLVILSHGDGYFTIYGHNKINLVSQRERVERGQPIAQVGSTGISQGPHLHFEIWKDSRSIDPRSLMDLYRRQDISVEKNG